MTTSPASLLTQSQWITVQTADGAMEAYLAQPADTRQTYPAILLFMEIFGVNAHIQSVADRLAAEGYVVIAPNYYHRSTPNLDLPYNNDGMTEGQKHKNLTTRQTLLADGHACMAYLDTLPTVKPGSPVAAMGFCFGGNVAYTLAAEPRVTVAICFYPGGVGDVGNTQAPIHWTGDIKGHVLGLYGEQDPLIPVAHMDATEAELQRHAVSHQVIRYPEAGHGFFCDARGDYNPIAANDAWQHVTRTLNEKLRLSK